MNIENLGINELDVIVTDKMVDMGVPAHLKGYQYLREAIEITIYDMNAATSVTKLLYPDVAKRYKTTDLRVERAIRNAVEVSWARGNKVSEKNIFGYNREDNIRPTNSEYIAKLADKIRLEIKAMPEVV